MSQFPPSDYPQNPPPGSMPPGYGYAAGAYCQQPRLSGAALSGFIISLIHCIPGLASLLGLVLGLVGLSATGKPNVSGRGFAIAAIIISLLGFVGWGLGGFGAYQFWKASSPARLTADRFVTALSDQKIDDSRKLCTQAVTDDTLDSLSKTLGPHARLARYSSLNMTYTSGGRTAGLVGNVTSADGTVHTVTFRLVENNGTWLIDQATAR